jgi:hypothetical protein
MDHDAKSSAPSSPSALQTMGRIRGMNHMADGYVEALAGASRAVARDAMPLPPWQEDRGDQTMDGMGAEEG